MEADASSNDERLAHEQQPSNAAAAAATATESHQEVTPSQEDKDGEDGPSSELSSSQLDKIHLSCTIGSLSQSEKGFRGDESDSDGSNADIDRQGEVDVAAKNLPDLVVNPYSNGASAAAGGRSDPFRPLDYSGPATAEDTEPARPEDVYGIAVRVVASKGVRDGKAVHPLAPAASAEKGIEGAGGADGIDVGSGEGGQEDEDDSQQQHEQTLDDNDVSSVEEADDGGSLDSSVPGGGSSGLSSVEGDEEDRRDDIDDDGAAELDGEEHDGIQSVHSSNVGDITDFDENDDDDAFMASSLVRLSGDQKHAAMREKKKRSLSDISGDGKDILSDKEEEEEKEAEAEDGKEESEDSPSRPFQQIMRGGGRGGMSKFEAMKRKRVALASSHSHDDDTSDDSDEEHETTEKRPTPQEASKIDAIKRLARGGGKGRSGRGSKKLRFADEEEEKQAGSDIPSADSVTITLLGSAQDGGLPQPGCYDSCCERARDDPLCRRMPVALGITGIDGSKHLVEASRCLGDQLDLWKSCKTYPLNDTEDKGSARSCPVDSVCITHAHLGHVDGLGLFGREVIGAKNLPLHCSASFKEDAILKNPVWNGMVQQGCIEPKVWNEKATQDGSNDEMASFIPGSGEVYSRSDEDESPAFKVGFVVRPVPIPHRAEMSDTHALLFEGVPSGRRLLFLPDQDCWDKTLQAVGCTSVREWLEEKLDVDIALLDGTFFNPQAELGNVRNVAEIPHPPVAETLVKLGKKTEDGGKDRRYIFCHLNHTNPLCDPDSTERKLVEESGWEVASDGDIFFL